MSRRNVQLDGPEFVDVHVGRRLKIRRAQLGISQSALGEKLGITFQQIQKYERGTTRVSASTLYKTACVLSVSISYFFDDLPAPAGDDEEIMSRPTPWVTSPLMTTAQAHCLLNAIIELPQPLRRKLTALVMALGKQVGNGEGEPS